MIFAAIDVGSNAVRMLISDIYRNGTQVVSEKTSLIRIPIRLGEDVFNYLTVSEEKIEALVQSFKAFDNLFKVYKPSSYSACATSALRESLNRDDVIKRISRETGLILQTINGITEAELITMAGDSIFSDTGSYYIFADVGGGSTELAMLYNGKIVELRSFRLGTVRILNHHDEKAEWESFKDYLAELRIRTGKHQLVGSGGNINKLSKLFASKGSRELAYRELVSGLEELSGMTLEKRISSFGLRHDRADVIIPAGTIFVNIMEIMNVKKILVPRIGLSDGLIKYQFHCHEGEWNKGEIEINQL